MLVFDNGCQIFSRNRIFGTGNAAKYSVSAKVKISGFGQSLTDLHPLICRDCNSGGWLDLQDGVVKVKAGVEAVEVIVKLIGAIQKVWSGHDDG
jgi:hypothetical protein